MRGILDLPRRTLSLLEPFFVALLPLEMAASVRDWLSTGACSARGVSLLSDSCRALSILGWRLRRFGFFIVLASLSF